MSALTAAMNEILAANIKTLRERLGLEQEEFADEMNVSQATISRWENGAEPKGTSLSRLASMSDCTVEEFTTQLLTAKPRAGEIRHGVQSTATLLLPVTLPNEDALTEMFAGLLEGLRTEKNWGVIAQRLAQRLPVALAQTVSRATSLMAAPVAPAHEATAPTPPQASP